MRALKDYKILFLALLVTVALGFQGLKHFQKRHAEQAHTTLSKAEKILSIQKEHSLQLEKKTLENRHAHFQKVNGAGIKFDLKAAISNYQKEHGLEESREGTTKKNEKTKAEDKDKNKKKKSQFEYVWDTHQGKWVKRRKLTPEQRERLLAKRQEMLEKMKQQKAAAETTKRNFATADGQISPLNSFTQNGPQPQNSNEQVRQNSAQNEDSRSYDEWARLLLGQPNSAALNEFINAFRDGQVSSEIFYGIASEMLNDPRLEMREQGLTLTHNFPSPQSFRLLVDVLATENPGAVRSSVEKIMTEDYASVTGLSVLKRIMNTERNSTVLIVATEYLSRAIQNLLNPPVEASKASLFSDFVGLLTNLSQPNNESELIASASQALSQLQSRIGQTIAALDSTPDLP